MTKDSGKVFSASTTGLNGGNFSCSGHVDRLRGEKWKLITGVVHCSGHYTLLKPLQSKQEALAGS